MPGGRPKKFKSVKSLEALIDLYFKDRDENKKPYTITGLALWLDTSRETLIDYQGDEEFSDTIKRAKSRCEDWVVENMLLNKVNAVAAIFNLKNNWGWKDKTETDVTTKGESINPSDEKVRELTDKINAIHKRGGIGGNGEPADSLDN